MNELLDRLEGNEIVKGLEQHEAVTLAGEAARSRDIPAVATKSEEGDSWVVLPQPKIEMMYGR